MIDLIVDLWITWYFEKHVLLRRALLMLRSWSMSCIVGGDVSSDFIEPKPLE